MSSLPSDISGLAAPPLSLGGGVDAAAAENEQVLWQAFRSFSETAGSLERSYELLRAEVTRLHGELAQSSAGLARSLAENRGMRQRLDRILRDLPCGVLVTNEDGTISLINPEGGRLLGSLPTSGRRTIGLDLPMQSPQIPSEEMRQLLDQARCEAGEREHCVWEKSGAEFWLAIRYAALGSADQDAKREEDTAAQPDRASIFILRDITEAKKLIQQRDKIRREQALAEMSAILAHEIRNPLGSLELFAGLLAKAGLPPEPQKWVEQIQAGLRTLAATVNNVLHFHSLPAPERVPIDLGCLLDWAAGFLTPMARDGGVALCLHNRLQAVYFSADRHRLEQVLMNLVLNALRAMPDGGSVKISGYGIKSQEQLRCAAISVSDTGPGLDAEAMDQIFEPGFSTRPGSPGLGLAVCRKIVEQHGGTLTAQNRVGAGASFLMTFPMPSTADDKCVVSTESRGRF